MTVSSQDILALVATTPGAIVVEASTTYCVPCRKLHPVLRKLAAEFAGHLTIVEADDSAEAFYAAHRVTSFPQLLFFRDGKYVRRVLGFESPQKARQSLIDFLGLARSAESSTAESAFEAAYERAEAAIEEIMAPANAALEPHLEEIDRVTAAVQANSAGLTQEELRAAYAKAYAPFADKVAALSTAQAAAMARYGELMATAVETFLQSTAAGASIKD